MNRILRATARICTALLLAQLLGSMTPAQAEEPGFVEQVVIRDVNKKLTKTDLDLLRKFYGLVAGDEVLARKVREEIGDAIAVIDGNANAMAHFFSDLQQISSKEDLIKLTEAHKLRAHAASVLESRSAAFAGKGDDTLRKLIGLGDDGADQAGQEALRLLRQAEDEIAARGALSASLDRRLTEAVRKLPPVRARAARQLVRNQLAAKGVSAFSIFLRTGVDGIFVLTDAYAISAMEDGNDKAAAASGAAVGYGLDVVGNIAVRALGGGAFLHGLVISLSAGKVAELVSEIIKLQHARADAAQREKWAEIELRQDAIRGMLRVDALIKAGQPDKAQALLTKVKQFYFKRPLLASDGDDLYAKMLHLEQVADRAGRLIRADQIIAEARVPYTQGYQLASRGRRLNQARNHVEDARTILSASLSLYPELKPALDKCHGLLAAIDQLLAHPPPLRQASISGPDRVATGEVQSFQVTVEGGIPDYHPSNIDGLALTTGVVAYWQAPANPGPALVTVRLRDDSGQTIEASKRVEVVDPTATASTTAAATAPASGEVRLRVYTVVPSYRENGRTYPAREVEAHDVYIGDNVHFIASPKDPRLHYRWTLNGRPYPDTNLKDVLTVYPEQAGIYTVVVEVSDAAGKSLGQSQWTFKAREYDMDFVDPRAKWIPEGD